MDRTVSVRTPESIAFSYELAGLGSRFLAVAFDMLVQFAILAAIVWGVFLLAAYAPHAKTTVANRTVESAAYAIVWAVIFVVFFGYFIVFEGFGNGQTPGKKLLGIRVVRDGGYPIDIGASFIRNLVRAGEFALAFYAVSAVSTILSPENKRLGDMAAGTIVVRDSPSKNLTAFLQQAQEQPSHRFAMLTDEEHAVIARFMARRSGMDPVHRRSLAAQIVERVRTRVSSDLQRLDDEELIERLSAI